MKRNPLLIGHHEAFKAEKPSDVSSYWITYKVDFKSIQVAGYKIIPGPDLDIGIHRVTWAND